MKESLFLIKTSENRDDAKHSRRFSSESSPIPESRSSEDMYRVGANSEPSAEPSNPEHRPFSSRPRAPAPPFFL